MRPYQKRKSRMSDVICRRADKHLTEGQLKDIAALIYDTDLYIYPAMFADRQEAETVLPKMIRAGDPMFRRENLFLTMQGTKVVGILLWFRGPLEWDKTVYRKCGGKAEHIDRVVMEYFNLFTEAPANMASLVRISVSEGMRGRQIGSLLTDTFMQEEKGPYQLYVLADNMKAIPFFEGKGFAIRETRPGFSLDYRPLPCYWMVRK